MRDGVTLALVFISVLRLPRVSIIPLSLRNHLFQYHRRYVKSALTSALDNTAKICSAETVPWEEGGLLQWLLVATLFKEVRSQVKLILWLGGIRSKTNPVPALHHTS